MMTSPEMPAAPVAAVRRDIMLRRPADQDSFCRAPQLCEIMARMAGLAHDI
jgi:hypothetical protein